MHENVPNDQDGLILAETGLTAVSVSAIDVPDKPMGYYASENLNHHGTTVMRRWPKLWRPDLDLSAQTAPDYEVVSASVGDYLRSGRGLALGWACTCGRRNKPNGSASLSILMADLPHPVSLLAKLSASRAVSRLNAFKLSHEAHQSMKKGQEYSSLPLCEPTA